MPVWRGYSQRGVDEHGYKTCPQCGVKFEAAYYNSNRVYCGKQCVQKAHYAQEKARLARRRRDRGTA